MSHDIELDYIIEFTGRSTDEIMLNYLNAADMCKSG